MEAFYRQVHELEGNVPQFPQHYPRGALLGCVWVAGCLPVRASNSPFIQCTLTFEALGKADALLCNTCAGSCSWLAGLMRERRATESNGPASTDSWDF